MPLHAERSSRFQFRRGPHSLGNPLRRGSREILPRNAVQARACGSTRISIATCVATIAVCARRPPRRGGRWASRVCKGLLSEAAQLGVSEIFVTGGEPFLLADIAEILAACAAAAPTTVLTNGMLFAGRGLDALRSLLAGSRHSADQPR